MANREALRELQSRLAGRLQTAHTHGTSVAWLAVRVGGNNLLFPLGQSGEIVPLGTPQSVPYVRTWFRGILNIRGGLYGIVDLAAFLKESLGGDWTASNTHDHSVITLNATLEVNCALEVDSLLGLRGADAFASTAPADPGAPAYLGNQFLDTAGVQWQEIDLRILSQTPQFLSISA